VGDGGDSLNRRPVGRGWELDEARGGCRTRAGTRGGYARTETARHEPRGRLLRMEATYRSFGWVLGWAGLWDSSTVVLFGESGSLAQLSLKPNKRPGNSFKPGPTSMGLPYRPNPPWAVAATHCGPKPHVLRCIFFSAGLLATLPSLKKNEIVLLFLQITSR
jgi:hypothetical protein